MKISALVHGVIDYVTVLFLLMAPVWFGMQSKASVFTYVLAAVHLLLTLFTDFIGGVFKIVPFRIHGLIEIAVSLMLICVAILFRTSGDHAAFYFYLVFSIVLFAVWALSDYRPRRIDL